MAEPITLARPYAKAAFEAARDASALQSWSDALVEAAAITLDSKVKALLSSPSLTAAQKAAAFIDLCGDTLNEAQKNFIRVLADNNRLPLFPQVSQLFELYKANQEKAVDVELQTAYDIDDAVLAKLATSLTEKLDRKVSLQTAIDPSLLGGAIIRAGDTVIDGSVRGRLAKLAETMSH
ncbi:F0F1 ATP synthase subunit delta [Teredinibacter turnerae]|uniref:F0F1 ATP synthase subunit delta n=1 Tax=Teredinibacter turnerae TaxID=2426 RepID=UPI000372ADBE|nr:F0F1 ATP synthase subunit delta [Teredinibacter turnerae]